jgi:hypothetical protein
MNAMNRSRKANSRRLQSVGVKLSPKRSNVKTWIANIISTGRNMIQSQNEDMVIEQFYQME